MWNALASAFSRCDATVRARGYRAAVAKIEGVAWTKGTAAGRVAKLNECISAATGVDVESVPAWASNSTTDAVAA